jgi:hypothetical protein
VNWQHVWLLTSGPTDRAHKRHLAHTPFCFQHRPVPNLGNDDAKNKQITSPCQSSPQRRSPEPVNNKMIIQIGLLVGLPKNLPDSAPCWGEWAAAGRSYQLNHPVWIRVGRSLDKRRSLMPSGRRYSINCVLASGNPHMLCRPSMCATTFPCPMLCSSIPKKDW